MRPETFTEARDFARLAFSGMMSGIDRGNLLGKLALAKRE
jgi:hypothetical protein